MMSHFEEVAAPTTTLSHHQHQPQQHQQQQAGLPPQHFVSGQQQAYGAAAGQQTIMQQPPYTHPHPHLHHHGLYTPAPSGANFFMHKYDYNPRLLFDNLQNMLERNTTGQQQQQQQQTTSNPAVDPHWQHIDVARIKLNDAAADAGANNKSAAANKSGGGVNQSQIDDLTRIEIDSSSVSMLNDVNDELILAIINDSKTLPAAPAAAHKDTDSGNYHHHHQQKL